MNNNITSIETILLREDIMQEKFADQKLHGQVFYEHPPFSKPLSTQEIMPVHDELVQGEIAGFRYYIVPCAKPAESLEIRLIVNVGSYYENITEQGFSHFIGRVNEDLLSSSIKDNNMF